MKGNKPPGIILTGCVCSCSKCSGNRPSHCGVAANGCE